MPDVLSTANRGHTPAMVEDLAEAERLFYVGHGTALMLAPDVMLLGLSFPNEQGAAFAAYCEFTPLSAQAMHDLRQRAAAAIAGKGPCGWNPHPGGP